MTYEELYKLFVEQNRHLREYIIDYRPAGKNKLEIFYRNDMMTIVTYSPKVKKFKITMNFDDVLKYQSLLKNK